MLIAYFLGANAFTDIFFTSFRLPNLFRSLFAEGAFTSSFVPIYGTILKEDKTKASNFVSNVLSLLTAILIVLVLVIEFNMGYVIALFAPGFRNGEYFDLLILLARIMFPYIIFVSLVSVTSGTLQAVKKFSAIAISPIILNVVIVIALLYSAHSENSQIVINLALSVIVAGSIQLTVMLFNLNKSNIDVKFQKIDLDSNLKLFFKRVLPISFSACIYQFNIFVDTFFASTVPFGVSYLYYADRINQLPLSLIGVSLSAVVLPLVSDALSSKDLDSALKYQNKALEIALVFSVPASVALFLLGDIVIKSLFMNSAGFNLNSAIETAKTLQVFAFALPAYVLNKIFLTTFFASGDTKSPMIFATVSLIMNIIMNLILIKTYKHLGIAFASTASAWVNVILILYTLRKKGLFRMTDNISKTFSQVFFSTSVMIFVLEILKSFFGELFVSHIFFVKLIFIMIISFLGASVYFGSFFLIKKFILRNCP